MAGNIKRPLRGNAPKTLIEPPLFVRLCQAFVDNLGIILKTGLVVGSILLLQDLLTGLEETRDTAPRSTRILEADRVDVPPRATTPAHEPGDEEPVAETFLSDGVQQALNCTYTEYRNAHYDECVGEPSDVYRHPPADPDDRGHLEHEAEILFADAATDKASRDL